MNAEYQPTERRDGEQTLATIEANIAAHADAARNTLARYGAMDLAECLGVAS